MYHVVHKYIKVNFLVGIRIRIKIKVDNASLNDFTLSSRCNIIKWQDISKYLTEGKC